MATSWESVDVGCPFYKASDGNFVRCEGVAGETVTMIFISRKEKADIMERYCNCRWAECPLYKAAADKYR